MSVAAIVLAAGASRRLGYPKQLIRLEGETLVERAVRISREAGCERIVLVLGASADKIMSACSFEDAAVVMNADWSEGMATSLAAGIRSVDPDPNVEGCIVMTCDMPAVTPEHLRLLMSTRWVTASAYAGRRGVPAYFPREIFPDLTELRGDEGARALLKEAQSVELEGGDLDIDTDEDLSRARSLF
ncbi:nucleotidyltransferase family protein [Edaphobacter sp. HDX4]